MKKSIVGLLLVTSVLLYPSVSRAGAIAPGTSGFSNFNTQFNLGADTLVDHSCSTEQYPATGTITVKATLCAAVFRNASGTLDFAYQVFNIGPDPISTIFVTDFGGFDTDLGFSTTSTGGDSDFKLSVLPGSIINPLAADRSSGLGSTITFDIDRAPTQIPAGSASSIIVISTKATAYTTGTINAANGHTLTDIGFSPATVPEPASMLLIGSGLGIGFLRRRLRRG